MCLSTERGIVTETVGDLSRLTGTERGLGGTCVIPYLSHYSCCEMLIPIQPLLFYPFLAVVQLAPFLTISIFLHFFVCVPYVYIFWVL